MKSGKYFFIFFILLSMLKAHKSNAYNQLSQSAGCCLGSVLLLAIFEPLIPDLRFEHAYKNDQADRNEGFDKNSIILAWPLHLPIYESSTNDFVTTLFIEPQYNYDNKNIRGLAGSRLIFKIFNDNIFVFETGGIKDKREGNGIFGSLGFGWGASKNSPHFAIICRTAVTQKEVRTDISFDFWTDWPFKL